MSLLEIEAKITKKTCWFFQATSLSSKFVSQALTFEVQGGLLPVPVLDSTKHGRNWKQRASNGAVLGGIFLWPFVPRERLGAQARRSRLMPGGADYEWTLFCDYLTFNV